MSEELRPCSHCSEPKNFEVIRLDMRNIDRDHIKCRNCGSQSSRLWWNTRHIPEGYKLVPVDITKPMLEELTNGDAPKNALMKLRYKAMIEAAE